MEINLKGKPPVWINAYVQGQSEFTIGGSMVNKPKKEVYVLLSAMPIDLQQKIATAVQAIKDNI